MTPRFPLVKLPEKIDRCLFLITQELKSRRFFSSLHSAGVDDVYLQPHLDNLILKYVGLDDGSDKTFEFYSGIMEKRSRKVETTNDSVTAQALRVYMELVAEKRRRRMEVDFRAQSAPVLKKSYFLFVGRERCQSCSRHWPVAKITLRMKRG